MTIFLLMAGEGVSYAFSKDFYAENSALSSGHWAKVEVRETGIQFLSDATIKALGFSNPEAVNIYGYGGVVIPENLDSPDDLPLVPSLRVDGGILFFGKANVGWQRLTNSQRKYSHLSHPYSDASYYFISDIAGEHKSLENNPSISALSNVEIREYTERLVHEQETSMPVNTGRLVLGEDFRTTTSRDFNFSLPGITGDALITVAFASKTSSGTSTLVFTANGNQLPATTSDRMVASSAKFITTTSTTKTIVAPGEQLDLNIKFNGSGAVTTAALDYIEIEYPRSLEITNNELYFYLEAPAASPVRVSGASASTIIWDVSKVENPKVVATQFENGDLIFTTPAGFHEYIAFQPSLPVRQATGAGNVSNQDIHSLTAPGLLVICPQEYKYAAQELVTLHQKTDGLSVLILTPEEIYNEFSSGKPDVSAFRKLLKMWYDRADGREGNYTEYCVIVSRPTFDNKMVTPPVRNCGYPRVPIWQSPTGETETTSYSTDDYIGMLKEVEGSFDIGNAEIQVAVGRMPVKSVSELNTVLDKLSKYLLEPDLGSWRNNVMVIADDQDHGVHLEQAEAVIAAMKSMGKGNHYQYEKLYLDSYPLEFTSTGAAYPVAQERMMSRWNEGTAYINYIGHANQKSWGHESLFTWTMINAMSNKRLPYLYAATCDFMRWDENDISGGEVLWLLPNSGVIGMICPSREVLITSNGVLNKSTSRFLFATDETGAPLPVGKIMVKGKNASNTGSNKLRYGLIGDPSMRVPGPSLNVKVDEINGVNLATTDSYPELQARSSVVVKGHVEDIYGTRQSDFNGSAEITLYDAEKVVTTNGNGNDGVVSIYNDRKTRLFYGRAKVINGEWSINFTMPSEIDNNYSPALLSVYAFDETSREANGSCEKLYAYGYDQTAPDDFEGPRITQFYLNSPNFTSGGEVGPNSVLYAKFYDDSGISVSEAGIGHALSLDIDGHTFFDDVAQYYVPDEDDSRGGSLSYPLGELEPGVHTLRLTVWDNANNSTTVSLEFTISALWKPTIETLTTDANPATTSVNFIIATDGVSSAMECTIEVFDINGRKVWFEKAPAFSSIGNYTTINWNLCDFAGAKVPGGIYLYKATVKTDKGAVTKTKKLVVR